MPGIAMNDFVIVGDINDCEAFGEDGIVTWKSASHPFTCYYFVFFLTSQSHPFII